MAHEVDTNEHKVITLPPRARLVAVAFILLLSTSAGFVGGWLGAKSHSRTGNSTNASQQVVLNESQLISDVAKAVGESVVSVNVTSQHTASGNFFGSPSTYDTASAGTGIILNSDGIIITNRHVVPAGSTGVTVTLSDGTKLDSVEVIGQTNDADPLDVAFLKVKDKKGKTLQPAKLGDSGKVIVGDKVIAIGNALGQFENSVTAGIISGFGRSIVAGDETSSESLQNLFQTDAAINPGNSGGPLVNINGEVIGMNTAIAGEAENIGFAIPINDIKGLIASVLDTGKLLRPYLGVRYVALTDDYAYQYNLDVKRGAYIPPATQGQVSIAPDSPAAKAGLKEKDVITKVNNQPIDEKNSLISLLGRHKVDEEVTLTVIRDGKEISVKAKLATMPQS